VEPTLGPEYEAVVDDCFEEALREAELLGAEALVTPRTINPGDGIFGTLMKTLS
jgi:hypothetical protein